MSEEVSFRSMKITLSEEALDLLDYIKRRGSFRSNSMTIEECIRAIFDVLLRIELAEKVAKGKTPIPDHIKLDAARYIAMRLARFTVTEIPEE